MPASVRLDEKTETLLRRLAVRTGKTKTQLVRDAVQRLAAAETAARKPRRRSPTIEKPPPGESFYDAIKDLIGLSDEKGTDARRSEEIFRKIVRAKHSRRKETSSGSSTRDRS